MAQASNSSESVENSNPLITSKLSLRYGIRGGRLSAMFSQGHARQGLDYIACDKNANSIFTACTRDHNVCRSEKGRSRVNLHKDPEHRNTLKTLSLDRST